jgi:hypothetical protein
MNDSNDPKDANERKEFVRAIWRLTTLVATQREDEAGDEGEEEVSTSTPPPQSRDWWEYVIRQTLLASQSSAREFCQYPTRGMAEAERRIFIEGYLWAIHVLWQAFRLDEKHTG